MHGLRDLSGKSDTPARLEQAKKLMALAQSIAAPDDLMVVCGDFNVEPRSQTITIMQGSGLTELVTEGGFPGTRTSLYPKPGKFADYMLVNRPEEVTSFGVVYEPVVSDHCPLVLEI